MDVKTAKENKLAWINRYLIEQKDGLYVTKRRRVLNQEFRGGCKTANLIGIDLGHKDSFTAETSFILTPEGKLKIESVLLIQND